MKMAPVLMQLKGLVWRNFLVKRRAWKRSVLEVFIPVLLVVAMILISLGVDTDVTPAVSEFPPHNLSMAAFAPPLSKPFLVSPDLHFTHDVMDHVTRAFNTSSPGYVVSNDDVTSSEMDEEYLERPEMAEVGVELLWKNTSEGVAVEGYVLRVPHELVKDVLPGCGFRKSMRKCGQNKDGLSTDCPGTQTLTSGLLSLQWAVESALIKTVGNDPGFKPPSLQVQMMPVPAFRPGATNTQLLVSLSMLIALAPLAYFIAVTLVMEKKTWARVMFKVMGVSNGAYWLSWWLPYMVTVLLVSVLATILVSLAGFLASSGLAFFFLLVLVYGASLLGFGCLVSVFFSTPKVAGLAAGMVSVLLGLVYLSVSLTRPFSFTWGPDSPMTESALPLAGQLVLSLLAPVAFALGVDQVMFDYEEGASSSLTGGHFPLLAAVLLLVLDTGLYLLLAVYLDNVLPGKTHLSHKPWFCFTPSYWRGRDHDDRENDVIPSDTPEGPHIEPVCDALADYTAVRARDLSKQFGSGQKELVYGLNGLDLDIFEGQITCVLGHPGAGKTTLMNILAGVMSPTSGAAYIYDLNPSNLSEHGDLTATISFCPQRDVILGHLTVEEHVYIAALLRGITWDSMEDKVAACLRDVCLDSERQRMARELSGCQKRRLSLAMALLADTKVLLLDEPTLGMGPEERRHVWKLLHAKKRGRVILITSRHVDEADYFADRTVVLSTGRLRCVGSSQFLKQHFNVGYHLDVTLRPATSTERLLRSVRAHVRGASLLRCDDDKVTITIPALQTGKLTALFRKLESKERGAEYLGISHFAISMTTLDQVFYKMGDCTTSYSVLAQHDDVEAEEEEAGNVFISPLLTPAEDTFADYDDNPMGDLRRESMFPTSMTRSMTAPHLEDLPRRFSVFPSRPASDVGSRRTSAFPWLQQHQELHRGLVSEDAASARKPGAISRRLSSIFTRSTPHGRHERGSVDFNPDVYSGSSGGRGEGEGGVSRRASLFAESIFKRRKDRSRSLAPGALKKSCTSPYALESLAEAPDLDLEERPAFNGTILPTSMAARRATVAAFKDFRRSVSIQSNMSGLGSLGEYSSSVLADPMAKLELHNSYELSRRSSLSDTSSTVSGLPSVEETTFSPEAGEAGRDPEKAHAFPAKIGEVLADLQPLEEGMQLELQRLLAMLKVRALLCLRNKWALLLRVAVPVLLALLAVGLSHAVSALAQSSAPPPPLVEKRTHLFGIERLVYRHRASGNLDGLLQVFAHTLEGKEHITEYTSKLWDPSVRLESLLDVLKRDGSAYKMYYNATCGLALPHLTSFISHVMRNSSSSDAANSSSSRSVYLSPRVSAWLQPWPSREEEAREGSDLDWVICLCLGLALLFTPAGYAVRMLRERKRNIRNYLGVVGVGRLVYYSSAFIIDVIEFLLPAVILIVLCAVSQMAMFQDEGAVECLVLLIILSVPVGVLWGYIASFAFRRPRSCLVLMPILSLLITVGIFCLVNFLDSGDSTQTARTLHYVFAILWPPYIRFGGLHYIAKAEFGVMENPPARYFFQFDSNIDICFILLLADVVVLSCLVLLLDKLTCRPPTLPCCGSGTSKPPVCHHQSGDDGVKTEIQRVQQLATQDKAAWPWLVVEGLRKVFTRDRQQLVAVNNNTFTVPKGHVLGLLGPPGAGKSTTINVMLGLCPASAGVVHMDCQRVDLSVPSKWNGKIGYCPQDNPLWDCLTVDHHIDLLGGIRGLHKHDLDSFRDSLYYDLDLGTYRSQNITDLSDCEKRKLSFAMSMLGQQSMMFLDQPSSGMDPRSRRLYWDAVNHFIKASQRGAVISTHCVEEAQVLCSRLAVMVNGQIRYLGSAEELQAECDLKYRLEVWLRGWEEQGGPQRMEMLTMFLKELFPGLRQLQQFQHRAVFIVHRHTPDFSLADTFDTLESLKRNLDLEDFTFSKTNLEQMFLDLAREQKEGDSKYCPATDSDTGTPSAAHRSTAKQSPEGQAADTRVDATDLDPQPSSPARDAENVGGASFQDAVSEADAAVGLVIVHHNGDDNGGGVAGVEDEGGAMDAGAAAPVVFSFDGIDNPAYTRDEKDGHEPQTSV